MQFTLFQINFDDIVTQSEKWLFLCSYVLFGFCSDFQYHGVPGSGVVFPVLDLIYREIEKTFS